MPTTSRAYFASPALYDLLYGHFSADVPLWLEHAREAPGPTLEVACGNGRILVPLRAAGIDIDGLDLDGAFLDDARRKLAANGLEATLVQGDMRDFRMPRRYGLIYIAFNSFQHNLTSEDQIATLARCREHLLPRGTLMVNVFSPDPAKLALHDGEPRLQIEHALPGGGSLQAFDAVRSDGVEQVMHVERRVEIRNAKGAVTDRQSMAWDMRWIWPNEGALLFRLAGFARAEVEGHAGSLKGDFSRQPELKPGDAAVWTAWGTA